MFHMLSFRHLSLLSKTLNVVLVCIYPGCAQQVMGEIVPQISPRESCG